MQGRHLVHQQRRAVGNDRDAKARSHHPDHRMIIIGFEGNMRLEAGLLAHPVEHIIGSGIGSGIDNERFFPEHGKICDLSRIGKPVFYNGEKS